MLPHLLRCKVLRPKVRWVHTRGYSVLQDSLLCNVTLEPQGGSVNVPDFASSTTISYTIGRGGVTLEMAGKYSA